MGRDKQGPGRQHTGTKTEVLELDKTRLYVQGQSQHNDPAQEGVRVKHK